MVRKESALRKRHHYKGIISSRRSAYFIYRFLEKARQKTKLVNPFPAAASAVSRNSRGAARGRSAFPLCAGGGRTARPHRIRRCIRLQMHRYYHYYTGFPLRGQERRKIFDREAVAKENLRGDFASEGRKLLSKIRIFYKIFQNLSPFF